MADDRITWLGHATALIEIDGVRLLTDPVLRPRLLRFIRRHAALPEPDTLRGIDAVLISHMHHDHLDFPSLRMLGAEPRVIAPVGSWPTFRRRGFNNVSELAPGGRLDVGAVEVTATHARHDGRRYKLGPAKDAVGFLVLGQACKVYFAGDTDLFPGMAALGGDLDAALLPIGGWGPTVGRGHLDARRAAEAAAMLRPRIAIPIHWGTMLRSGLERRAEELLFGPGRGFPAQLAARAPAVEPVVLEPGSSVALPPASPTTTRATTRPGSSPGRSGSSLTG